MRRVIDYINKRLAQMQRDKASPLIVSDGERELLKLKRFCLKNGMIYLNDR